MADQPIVGFNPTAPLYVQTYERYLPSAYDDSITILEKLNKVITNLNNIGQVSNDVLDQWNQVMTWVMGDGLSAAVDNQVTAMVTDGTLATVINETLFTDIKTEADSTQTTANANTTAIGTIANLTTSDKTNLVNAINTLVAEIGSLTTLSTTDKTSLVNAINSLYTTVTANSSEILALQTDTSSNAKVTNMKYYGTPEEYGAVGDGVHDDTSAIQQCLTNYPITILAPKTYLVTTTLTVPKNHSIQGNHALLLVSSVWTANTIGPNIPVNTVLYVTARDPVYQSELEMKASFIKDLRIQGNYNFSLTGIYLGTKDRTQVTQSSTVNYAVFGYNFANLQISYCNNGVSIGEAWQCTFDAVQTSHINGCGLYVGGQAVNLTFSSCYFATGTEGGYGAYIDSGSYNGQVWRPEGLTFIGGFIGEASNGVRIANALCTKFMGVVIDLNTNNAIVGNVVADVLFDGCYIYSTGSVVITLGALTANSSDSFFVLKNSNIVMTGTNAIWIGDYQSGIHLSDNMLTGTVTFAPNTRGSIKDCYWNQDPTASTLIGINTGAVVYKNNNTFKNTGGAVT